MWPFKPKPTISELLDRIAIIHGHRLKLEVFQTETYNGQVSYGAEIDGKELKSAVVTRSGIFYQNKWGSLSSIEREIHERLSLKIANSKKDIKTKTY